MRVAERIRAQKSAIGGGWEARLRSACPALGALDRAALIDHLPEFLEGLAAWVDGDQPGATAGFRALAEGHALQRLGFGVDLDTLTIEYQVLRSVILEDLLALVPDEELRRDLIRVNEGMDAAMLAAVRRYVTGRDQFRERFIGILGHDLRSPLHVAQLAFGSLAETSSLDAGARRTIARGVRAVARMDRMVHDVLDFARDHLGDGIPVRPTENDLGAISRAAVDDLRAAHPDRTIALELRGDLRGYWDRDRVVQAIANLIGNAVEHGGDPIAVRAIDAGQHVVTEVANPGPPIAPEVQQKMFEPFQRGGGGGLGLGLFIVRAIALAHGGLCDVDSDARETRFRITWPRSHPEETPGRP